MVCLGFEPGAAGWKAQTNPLSYGRTPTYLFPLKWRGKDGGVKNNDNAITTFAYRGTNSPQHGQWLWLSW